MPGQLVFNFRVLRITIPEISPICLVFTPLGMKYQWAKIIIIIIIIIITRNTFCGTWYLPHSRVHKSMNCAHSNRIPAEIWGFLILIFQDGGRRHLGFLKCQIFNDRNGQEGRNASACQISSKSLEPRLRYNNFSIFPRWRPSAILDL